MEPMAGVVCAGAGWLVLGGCAGPLGQLTAGRLACMGAGQQGYRVAVKQYVACTGKLSTGCIASGLGIWDAGRKSLGAPDQAGGRLGWCIVVALKLGRMRPAAELNSCAELGLAEPLFFLRQGWLPARSVEYAACCAFVCVVCVFFVGMVRMGLACLQFCACVHWSVPYHCQLRAAEPRFMYTGPGHWAVLL